MIDGPSVHADTPPLRLYPWALVTIVCGQACSDDVGTGCNGVCGDSLVGAESAPGQPAVPAER